MKHAQHRFASDDQARWINLSIVIMWLAAWSFWLPSSRWVFRLCLDRGCGFFPCGLLFTSNNKWKRFAIICFVNAFLLVIRFRVWVLAFARCLFWFFVANSVLTLADVVVWDNCCTLCNNRKIRRLFCWIASFRRWFWIRIISL